MVLSRATRVLPILALTLLMAGCDLIGDVLEFGFWTILIIVGLVVLVIWLVARSLTGRRRTPPPPPPGP
ncbi:MAG: hypothetical protein KY466_02835 [Gemmatimonadetes bacterium]|nr:hypothetical protein [Gemmatimonadota bacterium]